nr:MAG TPA: PilA, PilC, PilN, PilO, PilM, pilus, ring, membrane channel [Crassvirales sp.]
MIELIGCILLIIIGVSFICRTIDELKEKLAKYENAVADYETTMAEKEQLKKQLEEYLIQNIDLRADIMIQKMAFPNELIKDKTFYNLYDMPTYEELLAQQKEFIKYMNSCIKELEKESPNKLQNTINLGIIDITKTILQKYRSIIGGNDV